MEIKAARIARTSLDHPGREGTTMERSHKIRVLLAIIGISLPVLGLLPVPAAAQNHAVIQLRGQGTALQQLGNPVSISGTNGSASASADLPTGLLTINVSDAGPNGSAFARAQFVNDRLRFSGPSNATNTIRVRFTSTVKATLLRSGAGAVDLTSVFSIARGGPIADSVNLTYSNSHSGGVTTNTTLAGAGQVNIHSATATDLEAVASVEVDVPINNPLASVGLSNFIDSSPIAIDPGSTGVISGSAQVAVELPPGYSFISDGTLLTAQPPTADAGGDQSIHPGGVVTLDGSGSSDPNGRVPLTYAWQFTSAPAGSTAALSDPSIANPSFTVDKPGDYRISLRVTNALGVQSAPDEVLVSTTNTPPVAEAGPAQSIAVLGTTVQLDGTQSYDDDGDPFTYLWTLTAPPGSTAALSDPSSPQPTFVADVHADYVIHLVVTDFFGAQSAEDSVTVSFANVKPVADAGMSQSVIVKETVTLDGKQSHDANGDPLTLRWAFTTVPVGSTAAIADPTAGVTTFVPDLPGLYVVQLVVNDGFIDSNPSTTQVQAIPGQTAAVRAVRTVQAEVASLDPGVFKNRKVQRKLLNQLNAVLAKIDRGRYTRALATLEHLLTKTDGCATTGAPGRDDWIQDCEAQGEVYPLLLEAIRLVADL